MFKLLLFGAVLCVLGVAAKKKMLVHIENMNVESNKEFLDVSGSIRKSDEGINLVDVSFDLHHLVDEPIFIESEIFVKNDQGVFNSFLKGAAVDICDFFKEPNLNPILSLIMKTLNKYGNQLTSCPVTKMKFDIVGFRMDSDSLPAFIPAGEYRMEMKTTRLLAGSGELQMLFKFDCDSKVEKID